MDIIDGIKNIGKGIYQVGKGIVKAAWGLIKLLAASVVLVIVGIYYATIALFDFAKKAWKKIKASRPNVKVTSTGTTTGKVLAKALGQIQQEIANDTIKLSDLEKEEVNLDIKEINEKLNSPGKVTGMQYLSGINEDGEEEVFDAEIFEADAYDEETARRDREGKSYVQSITN